MNCMHECCTCQIPDTSSDEYCSEACRQHDRVGAHVCDECSCGHSDCRMEEAVSSTDMRA
jgi:hypothetical protein